MTGEEFRSIAVKSATIYRNYLDRAHKCTAVTGVLNVVQHGSELWLSLKRSISPNDIDSIELRIGADTFPTAQIYPVAYVKHNSCLILRPQKELTEKIMQEKPEHIFVVSSLLFLVDNVIKWYATNSGPFSPPSSVPNVLLPSFADMAGGVPSDEQYDAVIGVLTSPFTYVWGAPGTGKTRFVLANCVLSYLREDKKVLLTAPTNNALDQMLSGVLEVLLSAGISQSRVRRLGVPSDDLAKNYPGVCEKHSLGDRTQNLKMRVFQLRRKLEAAVTFHTLQDETSQLLEIDAEMGAVKAEYLSARTPTDSLSSLRTSIEGLQHSIPTLEQHCQTLTTWMDSFPAALCRFFQPRRYSDKAAELNNVSLQLASAQRQMVDLKKQLLEFEKINSAAESEFLTACANLLPKFRRICDSSCLPELHPFSAVSAHDLPSELKRAVSIISERLAAIEPVTEDAVLIKSQLSACESELLSIEKEDETAWADIRVLAMTIDRFITYYRSIENPDYEPAHIFMDEAAYCSLIKGFTLLGLKCPLTLLGDHAQLPPVCEMNDKDFNSEDAMPAFFWAQSSIHIDSVFHRNLPQLYRQYKNTLEPDLYDLRCYALSITYRFGPRLAQALSEHIYRKSPNGLRSAAKEESHIWYIHAPAVSQNSSNKRRISPNECQAIASLAAILNRNNVNFAILTPYNGQVEMLCKELRRLKCEKRILTVHASQGKEFHTVILSVVDTANRFFVDSNSPKGRSVLNTAISRTKSDLILVLDCNYWSAQKNQLLGKLLEIALPYEK